MATAAVLRPQDCLLRPNSFHSDAIPSTSPFKPRRNPQSMRSRRRKRSPVGSPVAKFPAKNLVMGQVKILKRGEDLMPSPAKENSLRSFVAGDLVVCSTDRMGPEPETVQKQIRVTDGLYAGSAIFLASPPPSSLPFPAFAKQKNHDAATSDLRRLLRLDLL